MEHQRVSHGSKEQESSSKWYLLLSLLFDPDDGRCTFLRNISKLIRLRGVLYQKLVLVIVNAVRTSNPAYEISDCHFLTLH
jgi:hypothetical protein